LLLRMRTPSPAAARAVQQMLQRGRASDRATLFFGILGVAPWIHALGGEVATRATLDAMHVAATVFPS
jgi:hypothetical protein